MTPRTEDAHRALSVAVIDGPYDAAALSGVLANDPVNLGYGSCDVSPNSACEHGTFIIGLLGARQDALIPGLCPDCRLLHVPLFVDANAPAASVDDLATAIASAVSAGARLINLSLAILGEESETNPRLAAALDFAETSGALLLVAAGNQGRLAMGQLLSHPVVIPVVAADASQRLLPDSNFGPAIFGRGIAALGRMPGYAPRGGTTMMSGTSVAAAVAAGTLAQVWSAYPGIDGATLRSVVAALGPRHGSNPPILNRGAVAAALDEMAPMAMTAMRAAGTTSYASLQGATAMVNGNGQVAPAQGGGQTAKPPQMVAPAGCGCGAPGGACTCNEAGGLSGFVYAIGTIEAEYPNVAIEREMQTLAQHLGVDVELDRNQPTRQTEDRRWQYAVLSANPKLTRHLARQLRWRLTVEDFPVFVLNPSEPDLLGDLIEALNRPKYRERKGEPRGKRSSKAKTSEIDLLPGPADDVDVVVGVAGAQTGDGISVLVDHIFQVDRAQFVPGGIPCFSQFADNRGLTDEDRAYNFLTARYKLPLEEVKGLYLSGMRVVPSRLGPGVGPSRIVRAIYTFENDTIEREYFVRVDVTHEFPMIVSAWQEYMDRGERS